MLDSDIFNILIKTAEQFSTAPEVTSEEEVLKTTEDIFANGFEDFERVDLSFARLLADRVAICKIMGETASMYSPELADAYKRLIAVYSKTIITLSMVNPIYRELIELEKQEALETFRQAKEDL